jgi:hypothetical protein
MTKNTSSFCRSRIKQKMSLADWKCLAKRYKLRGYSTQRKDVITQRVLDYLRQMDHATSKNTNSAAASAASLIQSNWRKYIAMTNLTCCLTYMTMRELKELGYEVYHIHETSNVVYGFSALHFATYLLNSLEFINPHTRRELHAPEIYRLTQTIAQQTSDNNQAQCFYQAWVNRETNRRKKRIHEESIALMKHIIFETIDEFLAFIQGLLPIFEVYPDDATYQGISYMHQVAIPIVMTHWSNVIQELNNYKRGNFNNDLLHIQKECISRLHGPPDCQWRPSMNISLLKPMENSLEFIVQMSLLRSPDEKNQLWE